MYIYGRSVLLYIHTLSVLPNISLFTRAYTLSLTHTHMLVFLYIDIFFRPLHIYLFSYTQILAHAHTLVSRYTCVLSLCYRGNHNISRLCLPLHSHSPVILSLTHTFSQLYTRDVYLHTCIPSRPFLSHTHLSLAIYACSLSVYIHALSAFLSFNMHTLVIFSHTHTFPQLYTHDLCLHACILCRPFLSYTHLPPAIYACSLLGKHTYSLSLLFVQYAHSLHTPSHTH